MSKHTPGPWTLSSNPKQILHRKEGHPYALLAEAHWGVFNDGTGQGSFSEEEVEANARLIAAAPEMLEALKQLRDAMIRYMAGSETHLYEVTQANAAIAKAEGK